MSVTPAAYRDTLLRVVCANCGKRFHAERSSALTCSPACRQARSRLLRATTPSLPQGPFDLIVADPPLGYRTWSPKGQGRSPGQHYQTLDLAALKHLPIGALAAKDAGLVIWVYGPRLPDTLALIEAWGFVYDSDLLSWLKITQAGRPRIGTGHTTRKTNEQALYAIKGAGLRRIDRGVPQAILAPRTDHSEKPEAAMLALERLFGQVRRLELFARRRRPGWTCWGNELSLDHGRRSGTTSAAGRPR